ncbi:MAG: hypothetical protein ACPGYX_06215 [Oceanobacter sp.]
MTEAESIWTLLSADNSTIDNEIVDDNIVDETQQNGELTNSALCWYWLPGWSFKATVFEPYYSKLPGAHYGLDYQKLFRALKSSSNSTGFAEAVALIQSQSKPGANWVGWSLGGALLGGAATHQNQGASNTIGGIEPRFSCALATGARFITAESITNESSSQGLGSVSGMSQKIFDAFCHGLNQNPAKTLKRFLSLCCQGIENSKESQKSLISKLGQHQISAEESELLSSSLEWLTQYQLAADAVDFACYAQHDALKPAGLEPGSTLGCSHAFLLEPGSQAELLNRFKACLKR